MDNRAFLGIRTAKSANVQCSNHRLHETLSKRDPSLSNPPTSSWFEKQVAPPTIATRRKHVEHDDDDHLSARSSAKQVPDERCEPTGQTPRDRDHANLCCSQPGAVMVMCTPAPFATKRYFLCTKWENFLPSNGQDRSARNRHRARTKECAIGHGTACAGFFFAQFSIQTVWWFCGWAVV